MNERDYGVGIANRYALFMGDEGQDPLEAVAKGGKGKENKQQEKPSGKKPGAAAAAAPSSAKTATSKSAAATTTAAAAGTGAAARGTTAGKQVTAPAPVKSGQREGKPPASAAAQPAKQQQQQQVRQQADPSVATRRGDHRASGTEVARDTCKCMQEQSAARGLEAGARGGMCSALESLLPPTSAPNGSHSPSHLLSFPLAPAAVDGKARPPLREPRPPRPQGEWTGQQRDLEERKNRRNRENADRGPLQSNNIAAPPDAG